MSAADASQVTSATCRESIEPTQRSPAMPTSVSQGQPYAYATSGTLRLLRRAPVRSEYVIDEEQSPNDPPPRPHLPTLAALLSESDMGHSNGELMTQLSYYFADPDRPQTEPGPHDA